MNTQKNKTVDARFAAWKVLYQVLEENQYSHLALQQILMDYPDLPVRDKALLERLVRGTLEHLYETDALIESCSRLPVRKLKPAIRTILRMSVYQLCHMDRIPARAVVNEAVDLTGKVGFSSLKGYVNGVLRNISRRLKEGYVPAPASDDLSDRLSMEYSIPPWLLKRYLRMFGETRTQGMLQAMAEPVRLAILRNPLWGSAEELKRSLCAQGVVCEPLPYGLDGYFLSKVSRLEQLSAFQEGAFLVQDVSSMLQGQITSAQEGNYVLDVCGAPGGKSLHAAMDMNGTGCVDCSDISQAKADLIRENIQRMHLDNIKVSVRDAREVHESLLERADIVIADLPCSGLGIMGRKPEIRYNLSEADITSLAGLQRQILDTIWRYVKPGGRLIYSTCTLTEEEDEENYDYLTQNLPFDPEPLEKYLPLGPKTDTLDKGFVKLIPGEHFCDGFFIGSAIRKK